MKKSFFAEYEKPLLLVALLILCGGIFSFTHIKSSLFPQITFPKIKVVADAGQQPIDRMEISVTRPLEEAIKQMPDLKVLKSTTSRGSCEISALMSWNADMDLGKQRIEARIAQIRNTLPAGTDITVEKMDPSTLSVMGYSLSSDSMSPVELKQLALYTIKPLLSQVAGVSDIQIIGGWDKEYWAVLDRAAMSRFGLTPEIVANAAANTDFIKADGYSSDYRHLYLTLTDTGLRNIEQLKNVVIKSDAKRTIYFKDIAKIEIHAAKQYIEANANGKESVLIAIIQQPGANVIDVGKAIRQKIETLRKSMPENVNLSPYYIQSDFVIDAIKSVRDALLIGLLLAMIVTVLFLRSFRASATVLITIPVTLSLTISVLYACGQTVNIMTLGAIAASIGLIIDDAIVIVEQIHRTHEEYPGKDSGTLVRDAMDYLFRAMIGSS
ncbi:MAG: efflux RND transporter permease subunit, partial [Bacteroidales bacterium]|nr:efflux RND transporter permease subunit [Bacteroidales bacterium]